MNFHCDGAAAAVLIKKKKSSRKCIGCSVYSEDYDDSDAKSDSGKLPTIFAVHSDF